jgi:hypothetical protein
VNVTACVLLMKRFGFHGVVLGSVAAYCTSPLVIALVTNRLLHVGGLAFWLRTYVLQGILGLVSLAGVQCLWACFRTGSSGNVWLLGMRLLASFGTTAAVFAGGNVLLNRRVTNEVVARMLSRSSGAGASA